MITINTTITTFEHQTLAPTDFSQLSDFQWLLAKVEAGELPCFTLAVKAGQVVLIVRHYLSVIRLPSGHVLEILPKISKQSLLTPQQTRKWVKQMLTDVYGLTHQVLPVMAQAQQNEIKPLRLQTWLEPIIEQWFQLLTSIQLPRQYQQNQQNNPQAQGKLLIKEQLKHNAHRPHYRYTSQQQLSQQSLWGQFFYTAMIKVQSLSVSIPKPVLQVIMTLEAMEKRIGIPINQQANSYHQLKQHLQSASTQQDKQTQAKLSQALELAWLILQMQDLPVASGVYAQTIVPAVMINMHQAFEKWITIKLSDIYPQRVQSQVPSAWLANASQASEKRILQPDILIHSDDKHTIDAIADIKYKAITSMKDIQSSDLYQLFTYQQHWQAKQAWLFFPKSGDSYYYDDNEVSSLEYITADNSRSDKTEFRVKVVLFDVETESFLF